MKLSPEARGKLSILKNEFLGLIDEHRKAVEVVIGSIKDGGLDLTPQKVTNLLVGGMVVLPSVAGVSHFINQHTIQSQVGVDTVNNLPVTYWQPCDVRFSPYSLGFVGEQNASEGFKFVLNAQTGKYDGPQHSVALGQKGYNETLTRGGDLVGYDKGCRVDIGGAFYYFYKPKAETPVTR